MAFVKVSYQKRRHDGFAITAGGSISVSPQVVAMYDLNKYERAWLYYDDTAPTLAIVFTNSANQGTRCFAKDNRGGGYIRAKRFLRIYAERGNPVAPPSLPLEYKVVPARQVGIDQPGSAFVVALASVREAI